VNMWGRGHPLSHRQESHMSAQPHTFINPYTQTFTLTLVIQPTTPSFSELSNLAIASTKQTLLGASQTPSSS
jgi:hypothetical protein